MEQAPLPSVEVVEKVNDAGITRAEFDRNWPAFLRKRGIPANHADKSGKVDNFKTELLNLLIDIVTANFNRTCIRPQCADQSAESSFRP